MRRSSRMALVGLLGALAGCVEIQKTVPPNVSRDRSSGYVAGVFRLHQGQRYGFVLADAPGREYVMSFGDTPSDEPEKQLAMIAVPPGEYRVSAWITYPRASRLLDSRNEMKHPVLSKPFEVSAGEVLFLGSFSARTAAFYGARLTSIHYEIRPERMLRDEAVDWLRDSYPAFANAPVQCILCM